MCRCLVEKAITMQSDKVGTRPMGGHAQTSLTLCFFSMRFLTVRMLE